MAQTNQVANQSDVLTLIKNDDFQNRVGNILPEGNKTRNQFIEKMRVELLKNPKLKECNAYSVLGSALEIASYGLTLGREAYMIPRKGICYYQFDYKGLITLALRSNKVSNVYSELVYPNDEFDIEYGSNKYIKHRPNWKNRDHKQNYTVAYAHIQFKDGGEDFVWMSKAEIDDVAKSRANQSGSAWDTDEGEMAKKTPLKRLLKRQNISAELQKAVVEDEKAEIGKDQRNNAYYAVGNEGAEAEVVDTNYTLDVSQEKEEKREQKEQKNQEAEQSAKEKILK